jgi:hypothetical protein
LANKFPSVGASYQTIFAPLAAATNCPGNPKQNVAEATVGTTGVTTETVSVAAADWQVILFEVTREYTDAVFTFAVTSLMVYVALLATPAGFPLHVYVAPATGLSTLKTTPLFEHSAPPKAVIVGVEGNACFVTVRVPAIFVSTYTPAATDRAV